MERQGAGEAGGDPLSDSIELHVWASGLVISIDEM